MFVKMKLKGFCLFYKIVSKGPTLLSNFHSVASPSIESRFQDMFVFTSLFSSTQKRTKTSSGLPVFSVISSGNNQLKQF